MLTQHFPNPSSLGQKGSEFQQPRQKKRLKKNVEMRLKRSQEKRSPRSRRLPQKKMKIKRRKEEIFFYRGKEGGSEGEWGGVIVWGNGNEARFGFSHHPSPFLFFLFKTSRFPFPFFNPFFYLKLDGIVTII